MANDADVIDAVIEIPMGSRNKYEYDPRLERIRLDRVLFASVVYPAQYGFIPQTSAGDGDPLDVLVLANEPVFPGCVVPMRLLGALHMCDQGKEDYKILGVTACDPRLDGIQTLSDIPPQILLEIENFFRTYKDLEGKRVEVSGWEDLRTARHVLARGRAAWLEMQR